LLTLLSAADVSTEFITLHEYSPLVNTITLTTATLSQQDPHAQDTLPQGGQRPPAHHMQLVRNKQCAKNHTSLHLKHCPGILPLRHAFHLGNLI